MNVRKRGLLYIGRNKRKTGLLFMIFLLVSTLCLLCTVIAKEASVSVKRIRESIGGEMYIRPTQNSIVDENGNVSVGMEDLSITEKTIQKILSDSRIQYWNSVNYGYAKSKQIMFLPGKDDNPETNMGRIQSTNYSELHNSFIDKTWKLKEGEHIIEGDKEKILITDSLAETNGLKVGDIITLESSELKEKDGIYCDGITEDREAIQVKIKGIYSTKEENVQDVPTAGMPENNIIASFDVLEKLKQVEAGTYKGEQHFFVKDPKQMKDIEQQMRAIPDIDWSKYFIYSNDFKYSKVSENMEETETLMKTLRSAAYSVGILILFLMLIINIRNRKREAGIYLSIGISKWKTVIQYLWEIMLIFIPAFLIAIFVAEGISGIVADKLFVEVPEKLISVQTLGLNNVITNGGLKILDIIIWGCMETVGICGAVVLAAIPILRLQPKTILSQME
ncbi:FtsX-like permease family protein [Mediterraneibacter gnavus]|uniref:FtsX-like permease family protein n=1 Tax=Mediterraneibacter gnavus TaxID=33038 RepID=UPI00366DDCCB